MLTSNDECDGIRGFVYLELYKVNYFHRGPFLIF